MPNSTEVNVIPRENQNLGTASLNLDDNANYQITLSPVNQNTQYNFAYIIDVSDSMSGEPLQAAKNAYISLTNSLIDSGIAEVSQFAVIPFGSDALLNAPLNPAQAISTIEGLSLNGFTNFNAALEKANQFFSTVPPGATNKVYFLSDGFSTTGGSFKNTAKALQSVADVQAYGFGAANIQQLNIVDSDKPTIVSQTSELADEFVNSILSRDDISKINILLDDKIIQTIQPEELKESSAGLTFTGSIDGLNPEKDTQNKLSAEIVYTDKTPDTTVDLVVNSETDKNNNQENLGNPVPQTIQVVPKLGNELPILSVDDNMGTNIIEFPTTFENNKPEYPKVAVIENDNVEQTPQIVPQNAVQNIIDGNLLNLESFTGNVAITFAVDREALFDNTVGFYKIEDAEGTITEPITGNKLKPSDGKAYAELALKLHQPELELTVDNLSSTIIQDSLSGGYLYAPFMIADGNLDTLKGDFSQVYFSFAQANSDGVEHIRSLGNNSLGFEDLWKGGDNDFNDMVIRTEITMV
ncbi:MAG: VWA domain-containing protein [Rivularia sp. T60_A2020_040]|nr:VWA domain-containing protein [Rivularia sp. T60_A2020_040]